MKYTKNQIKKLTEAYAKLVALYGINLETEKRSVIIKVEPQNYDFAQTLAIECYKAGSPFVDIEIIDNKLLATMEKCQSQEQFNSFPPYTLSKTNALLDDDWAYISIDTLESYSYLEDCNPSKLAARSTASKKLKTRYLKEMMANKHPWCVIAYPGPKWAKTVFPKQKDSLSLLWDKIISILGLDQDDPIAYWKKQNEKLRERQDKLNSLKIKELHYTSSKTDLTFSLRQEALWVGGGDYTPSGMFFMPNIPTCEIFSAPDKYTVNGHVTTTKPVTVLGQETLEVCFNFENGKVTSFTAKKGEKAIEEFLNTDEGSRFIGECALVDESSPISQANCVFGSILYDENASCHLALGQAYDENTSLELNSDEDFEKAGLNVSHNHTDFMVGSKDLNIDAVLFDGSTMAIMENGLFVI